MQTAFNTLLEMRGGGRYYRGLAEQPFNTLLEMPRPPAMIAAAMAIAFNTLLEMLDGGVAVLVDPNSKDFQYSIRDAAYLTAMAEMADPSLLSILY